MHLQSYIKDIRKDGRRALLSRISLNNSMFHMTMHEFHCIEVMDENRAEVIGLRMKLAIQLRPLKKIDLLQCIILFQNTVHAVNANDYSPEQLDAWAPLVKPDFSFCSFRVFKILFESKRKNPLICSFY
jgi:hypothetical protein